MTSTTLEQFISKIDQLNLEEQQEIFQQLGKRLNGVNGSSSNTVAHYSPEYSRSYSEGCVGSANPLHRDRSREYAWLEKHRAEYIGQWVALEGDQLLAHSPNLKVIRREAKRGDFEDALMILIENADGSYNRGCGDRIVGINVPMKDRSRENNWLQQHRSEYGGEWLALDGDRLLSHGPNLKEVAEEAKRQGVNDALYVRAESPDELPWAGF